MTVKYSATITNATITTGGISQEALPENLIRNYLEIINYSSEDLWVNFVAGGDAGVDQGFKLSAGQSWTNPANFCPTSNVLIYGATTGSKYAIIEG